MGIETIVLGPSLEVYGLTSPSVIAIERLYDPDIHTGPDAPQGLIRPCKESLVVDNRAGGDSYVIWVVDSVDPVTHKSTLVLPRTPEENDIVNANISFGNERVMLYFDNRPSLNRLIIDSKFVVIGLAADSYRLVKRTEDGPRIMSTRLDADGNIEGDLIKLSETTFPDIRVCPPCHTLYDVYAGDIVMLEIYDASGILITEVELITKQATILNDMISSNNPVVGFLGEASNMDAFGNWLIYVDQDPNTLSIFPKLQYADGGHEILTVDSMSTFMYGYDFISSEIIGREYEVLLKHYLAKNIPSLIAEGSEVRFVTDRRTVKIIPRDLQDISKVSLMIHWDMGRQEYIFTFYAYSEGRKSYMIIQPSDIEHIEYDELNGTLFDQAQICKYRFAIHVNGAVITHEQMFVVWLYDPGQLVQYTITDDINADAVYGVDTSNHRRPIIWYDELGSDGKFFISTTEHEDVEAFLDDFYYRALPPYIDSVETEAPRPTHFTIRELATGRGLSPAIIPIEDYSQIFNLISSGDGSEMVDSTVVVEFLLKIDGYLLLYGVPVSIKPRSYNP